jgi:ribosomal protein S27AE
MQVSQYLCSKCGSILKETSEYIEIHSLKEECPSCGSMLAEATNSTPDQDPAADDSKGKRFAQAAIRHSKV